MIKLLLLDWNGTLFDDREVVYGSVAEIFRQFYLQPPPPEVYFKEITIRFMNFYRAHGIPETATPNQLNRIRHDYFLTHWQEGRLRPGTRELLIFARNKGIETAIASAEVAEILHQRVDALNLRQLLNFIHGGLKDKAHNLKRIVAQARLKPEDTTYADDTVDGLSAAKSVGIQTIGFTNGYNTHGQIGSVNPNYFAHTLWDIITIIKENQNTHNLRRKN